MNNLIKYNKSKTSKKKIFNLMITKNQREQN